MVKTIVIGLDGVPFDLINKFIKSQDLMFFKKIIKMGTFGELKTEAGTYSELGGLIKLRAINSVSAWVSFATGKQPKKHGLHSFHDDKGNLISSEDIKEFTIWDILSNYGYKCGIVNIPVTYPPKKINGFMISGILTPNTNVSFTYPKNLIKEMPNYEIHFYPEKYLQDNYVDYRAFLNGAISFIDKQKHNIIKLMINEEWDFFCVNFQVCDAFLHYFWHLIDESHPQFTEDLRSTYGNPVLDFLKYLGTTIYDILIHSRKIFGEDIFFFVISDHGMGSKFDGWDLYSKLRSKMAALTGRRKKNNITGVHYPYGFIIALGPNICQNKKEVKANLIDLTPTILSIYDISIPEDMDGKVLDEIFIKES
ncbi:MAG: alkaline phosphatase family protein [Candidatus Hodarchaeota archaeon]